MVHKTKPFSIIFTLILGISLTVSMLLSLSRVPVIYAANITVNTTIDDDNDSDCSLREAVKAANLDSPVGGCPAGSGHDLIQFSLSTPIVLTLTNQILIENDPLTISGPGVDQLAISGNDATRIFDIAAGVAVTLTDMTLQNGSTTLSGGAVHSKSPLTLIDAAFVSNNAGADGGAIDTESDLTLRNTDILTNTANGEGGGVNAFGSNTVVENGRFINNFSGSYGGGLYVYHQLMISGTQIISNTANQYGGGVLVWEEATVTNTYFERNTSKYIRVGALYVRHDLQLTDSIFISNTAGQNIGAVWANQDAHIIGSTFAGNTAGTGETSALKVSGGIWLTDTQFIENETTVAGGAVVHVGDNGRLVNTLFANNKGGAATFEHSGSLEILHNTLVGPDAASHPAIAVDATGSITIQNSIFSGYQTGIDVTNGTVYEDTNLFHDTALINGAVSQGGNSYEGDPAFVDAANGDFHLSANSEALNTAVDVGVGVDEDGDVRPGGSGIDIGYDETTHTADLSISKAAISTPGPAQPIIYTLTFDNLGTAMLPRLTVTDVLPVWIVQPITISSSVVITDVSSNAPYVWQIHNLAPGASGVITVSGVLSAVLPQSFTNTVTINSIAVETNLTNNADDAVVNVPNVGPVAVNDIEVIDEDETAVFFPLTNDIDGDVLFIESFNQPGQGTAVLSGTQQIVYTPTLEYNGPDSFTYTVSDGNKNDTATVMITVTAVNDAPILSEGALVTITISEDNDPTPFNLTLNASDVESSPLTWEVATPAGHGTANAAAGPANSSAISYTPIANYFGPDQFQVQVSDGELTDSVTISVTVEPINDAPVAVDDTAVALRQPSGDIQVLAASSTRSLNVLDNDSEIENDAMTVTDVGNPNRDGIVSVDGSGTLISYAPLNSFTGMETFTYTVKDGELGETAVVSMTVVEGIDGGVGGDSFIVSELWDGQTFTISVEIPENVANGENVALVFDRPISMQSNSGGSMETTGLTFDLFSYLNGLLMDESYPFKEPITLTISYDNTDLTEIGPSENSLALFFAQNGDWANSGVQVIERDPINNQVTFTVNHAGSFTLLRQGFVFLPLITNNFVQAPDLVVDSITVLSADGNNGMTGNIQVVISNVGNGVVVDEFWVDAYIDPTTVPTAVNHTWPIMGDHGMVWGVTAAALPLQPGEQITLTINDTYYYSNLSNMSWPLTEGTMMYAQVDSSHSETTYGGVLEHHEINQGYYNNIAYTEIDDTR